MNAPRREIVSLLNLLHRAIEKFLDPDESATMLRSVFISVVFLVLAFNVGNTSAIKAKCWRTGLSEFGCYGISKFSQLDKASSSIKSIVLHTSELTNVPGNTFYRFRNKLQSLDMHVAGIQTIDARAFNGLVNLRNLTLWGNSLEAVFEVWFSNLTQLRILDLSFNKISYIEETAFQWLPNLENLYIDSNNMVSFNWNVFSYLRNLKTAKIGKNPWNWWYRAQITRQLDNQNVDYSSEWDDYDWINHVVWDCMEKHQAKYEDDSVLDCATSYLLEERSKITSSVQGLTHCGSQSKALYDCAMRFDPLQNVTITPKIAVRKILQGLIGTFDPMRNPDVTLKYRTYN